MVKKCFYEILENYDMDNNIINKNVVKCMLKSLVKNGHAKIDGQFYVYDLNWFEYLLNIYNKINLFFDFYYSLKSDIISMFDYMIDVKKNKTVLSFNAFFCPGYSSNGGYKNYVGNTTSSKLKILSNLSELLTSENIPYTINCYYCDSYIENFDDTVNSNWYNELIFNRNLFDEEASKYFTKKNIIHISNLDIFKDEKNLGGHIDDSIIKNINKKVYRSFYIANKVFYEKLNFDEERIKERNDILATMYILVSNYINGIKNGIYLPMENMYDREKIISNNGTCTMYLKQGLVKNEK